MKILRTVFAFGMAAAILFPFSDPCPGAFAATEQTPASLIERYRLALEVDPENPALHYCLGVVLRLEQRPAEAVAELRRAYPAYAASIEMNYSLGIVLTRLGDADSAQIYLEQAEALGALDTPGIYPLASAYYNIGQLYVEASRTAEARRIFRKVLELAPERIDIHRLLGEIYKREDSTDKAIESFRTYLAAYPADSEVHEYLFAIYFNNGLRALDRDRLEAARRDFDKALEVSPGSPVAAYYLGIIAYRQQRWEDTVELLCGPYADYSDDLRRAARSRLFNAALALKKSGNPERAAQAVSVLLEHHPDDGRVLFLAGNIYLDLQQFVEARSCYERLLESEPGHAGATINLITARSGAAEEFVAKGREYSRQGQYLQAATFFRRALDINPADPTARAGYDKIQLELDRAFRQYLEDADEALAGQRYRKAMDAALAARRLRPESPQGGETLERVRAAANAELKGHLGDARTALEESDFAAAQEGFIRALGLDPQSAEALQGLDGVRAARHEKASTLAGKGKGFLGEGRLDKARQAFNAALDLEPEHAAALDGRRKLEALVASMFAEEVKWARRAVSEGRLEVAELHYAKALQLKDDATLRAENADLAHEKRRRLEGLLAAARHASGEGDYRRAKTLVRRALATAPENAPARQLLVEISAGRAESVRGMLASADEELRAGEPERALARYREVLILEPGNGSALAGLESARQAVGTEVERLTSLAAESLELDRPDEAQELIRRALALDPCNSAARDVSKRIASERRRWQDLENADVDSLYLDGIRSYTRGVYPEALEVWEKVLAVDPAHDRARLGIEKVRRKLERVHERQNG